jgi:hypothetical protein
MSTDDKTFHDGRPYGHNGRGLRVDELTILKGGISPAYAELFEDFLYKAGTTLVLPTATTKSGANSVAADYVTSADGGTITITTTTNNEAQTNRLDHADNLGIDIGKVRFFEARFSLTPDVTGASGAMLVGDELRVGLAAAHNATLDSNALHAWFGIDNAGLSLLYESDDGTTDVAIADSGLDVVAATFVNVLIDFTDGLADVRFYADVSGSAVPDYRNGYVGSTSMAAASGNVQPYCFLGKAAATNSDHTVTLDFWRVVYSR